LGTTATGTTVTSGAALEVEGDITVGAEALTLDVASGNAIAGAHQLTFGGAGNISVADPIATSGVTKDGSGTLTLSGASGSFGGPITVSAGTLAAASSAALGTGAVSIASGASLRLDPGAILANAISTSTTGSILFAGGGLQRTSDQAVGTVAQFVAGSTGANAALDPDFTWSGRIADVTYSDVLDLTNTSGNIQILQLTYDDSLLSGGSESDILLGWKSGLEWVNAIDGNTGSAGGLALTNADGGYAAFGILPTADYLGSWGRDTTAKTVWAVVNHNSEYSSIIVAPEPGTLALAGIAVAGLLLVQRRRG